MKNELEEPRDANEKLAAAKEASEEKLQKEIERVKAERDRTVASLKRTKLFDVNYWRDAHDTAVLRCKSRGGGGSSLNATRKGGGGRAPRSRAHF